MCIRDSHIIIKRIFEGEVHFLQPDPFLNGLQEALTDWPNDCATLIMGDVNLKENITRWYAGHETRIAPFECLSMPLALLKRTQEYDVNKSIPKPKEYEQKYKKFICLNAAAKPHRAKLLCHLIDNEGHEGYISWLNRYGKLPEKHFAGSKFKGEEMLLDFEAKIKEMALKYNTQLDTAKIKADADLDKMIMSSDTKIIEQAQKSANMFSDQLKGINESQRPGGQGGGDQPIQRSQTDIRE